MHSHLVRLDIDNVCRICICIYFMLGVLLRALARLQPICTDWPEYSLVAYGVSIAISCAGSDMHSAKSIMRIST